MKNGYIIIIIGSICRLFGELFDSMTDTQKLELAAFDALFCKMHVRLNMATECNASLKKN